jgi:hypothetical protein
VTLDPAAPTTAPVAERLATAGTLGAAAALKGEVKSGDADNVDTSLDAEPLDAAAVDAEPAALGSSAAAAGGTADTVADNAVEADNAVDPLDDAGGAGSEPAAADILSRSLLIFVGNLQSRVPRNLTPSAASSLLRTCAFGMHLESDSYDLITVAFSLILSASSACVQPAVGAERERECAGELRVASRDRVRGKQKAKKNGKVDALGRAHLLPDASARCACALQSES